MTLGDWLTIAGLAALLLLPVWMLPAAKSDIYICVGYCPKGARNAH